MTNYPPLGLVDVFAATIPTLKFSPGVHVNYAETVLPMRDGLPKFKDFPADFGGRASSSLSRRKVCFSYSRYFERVQATSAFPPRADISLQHNIRDIGCRSEHRELRHRPRY